MKKNEKGFSAVEGLLIVVIVVLIGCVGWYVLNKKTNSNTSNSGSAATNNSTASSTTSTQDKYAGWQTYTAATAGFTLRYPSDWKIDASNSDQYSFNITAPDGIKVSYRPHVGDQSDSGNADKIWCGQQSACFANTVRSIDELNVNNLGKVMLITTADDTYELDPPDYADGTAPRAYLDQPLSSATTPKVGVNQFTDYQLAFSLPSKTGNFRYALFVTDGKSIKNRSVDDFFSSSTVKTGIDILKSIRY